MRQSVRIMKQCLDEAARADGQGPVPTHDGKIVPPHARRDEALDGSADPPLQALHRRLPRAGGRGLCRGRGAEGRVRRLSGRRRHQQALPLQDPRAGLRRICRRWTSCAAATCWPTSRRSSARSTSCSARSTAERAAPVTARAGHEETCPSAASRRESSPRASPSRRRTRLGRRQQIAKYPPGRQASAVIPLLWRAQEQDGGWLPQAAIEAVAACSACRTSACSRSRPSTPCSSSSRSGSYFVQLCGTTPCMLRGAASIKKVLRAAHRRAAPRHGRRQVLLARGRVPRRLLQRADGADQRRLLRGPDAGELREAPRRSRRRPAGEAGAADRPRHLGACRRREDADRPVAL